MSTDFSTVLENNLIFDGAIRCHLKTKSKLLNYYLDAFAPFHITLLSQNDRTIMPTSHETVTFMSTGRIKRTDYIYFVYILETNLTIPSRLGLYA